MKRMLEMPEIDDPGDRRLASLFGAVRPSRSDPVRMQRIRARIGAHLNRHSVPNRPRTLQWVIVGSVLIVGTAGAAILGARFHASSHLEPSVSPSPNLAASAKPSDLGAVAVATPEEPKSAQPEPAASVPHVRSVNHTSAVSSEDPTLVAAAIQALRKNHDPARARRLLNQYLRANPHGALAEEALALSIEAANDMGDPRTATLACRYLSLYPNGRSRALASRVCEKAQQ